MSLCCTRAHAGMRCSTIPRSVGSSSTIPAARTAPPRTSTGVEVRPSADAVGGDALEQLAGRGGVVGVQRELHGREVGGARLGERRACPASTSSSVPMSDTSAGPPGALGVHHAAVRRAGRCSPPGPPATKPFTLSASLVTHTGTDATIRGAGRPASAAAASRAGLICSAIAFGPLSHRIDPDVREPGQLQHPRPHGGEHHRGRLDRRAARRPSTSADQMSPVNDTLAIGEHRAAARTGTPPCAWPAWRTGS